MDSITLLQRVVDDPRLKERVSKIKSFTDSKLNGEQVYLKFMEGKQTGEKGPDCEMDVDITLYNANTSTIGYTYSNVVGTWINKKFFNIFTPAEVCGNISHEYLHKLGFTHSKYAWPSRKYSVPYAIGYIIEALAKEISKELNLES